MTHAIRTTTIGAGLLLGAMLVAPTVGDAADHVRPVAVQTHKMHGEDVEARIKTLHGELRITPEQESQWKDVANAMRENAKTMTDLRSQQADATKSASAPEMIEAFGKTMDAHANAIHRFGAVFQTLYDGMSAPQKRTADAVFRERVEQAAKRSKS
jgi:hypothetical protein